MIGLARWVDARRRSAAPPPAQYGPHHYPGTDDPENFYTSDCSFGCGAWMGGSRSGGPTGSDPNDFNAAFGPCPKNPIKVPAPSPWNARAPMAGLVNRADVVRWLSGYARISGTELAPLLEDNRWREHLAIMAAARRP